MGHDDELYLVRELLDEMSEPFGVSFIEWRVNLIEYKKWGRADGYERKKRCDRDETLLSSRKDIKTIDALFWKG